MPELKKALEIAGFTDVKTVLGSGNIVFSAPPTATAELERQVEAAIEKHLGRTFLTHVRPVDALRKILAENPYASFRLKPGSKRIVTFLRGRPRSNPTLPIELDGARILCRRGNEVFSVYLPNPRGPGFMSLIEKTFGKDVTTRTWETVEKIAR